MKNNCNVIAQNYLSFYLISAGHWMMMITVVTGMNHCGAHSHTSALVQSHSSTERDERDNSVQNDGCSGHTGADAAVHTR